MNVMESELGHWFLLFKKSIGSYFALKIKKGEEENTPQSS
jgi:hypothetical protein